MTAALRHWATAIPPLKPNSRSLVYILCDHCLFGGLYALVAITAALRHWATAILISAYASNDYLLLLNQTHEVWFIFCVITAVWQIICACRNDNRKTAFFVGMRLQRYNYFLK